MVLFLQLTQTLGGSRVRPDRAEYSYRYTRPGARLINLSWCRNVCSGKIRGKKGQNSSNRHTRSHASLTRCDVAYLRGIIGRYVFMLSSFRNGSRSPDGLLKYFLKKQDREGVRAWVYIHILQVVARIVLFFHPLPSSPYHAFTYRTHTIGQLPYYPCIPTADKTFAYTRFVYGPNVDGY